MKSIIPLSIRVLVTAAILISYAACGAVEYKSREFNDKKSSVPNVYICTIVGFRMQFEPNAYQLLEKFERISKVPSEKSILWKSDAELWWDFERKEFDLKRFWNGECLAPFKRIKKL